MYRLIPITCLLLLVACSGAPQPSQPLEERFSDLTSDVEGQGEALRALDKQVAQTNDRVTQQTISQSQTLQAQRRQAKQLLSLADRQAELGRTQLTLAQRYNTLRVMVLQTRLDEVRAQIEYLRGRQKELETQLRDEQDRAAGDADGAAGEQTQPGR